VFPNFRFNVFAERADVDWSAPEPQPAVEPLPGDDPLPGEVLACESPEEMVALFHRTLAANPQHMQEVHVTKVAKVVKSDRTEFLDLGYTPVLGLKGEHKRPQIHLRRPVFASDSRGRRSRSTLHEGDLLVLRYVGRSPLSGETHFSWTCRVTRCGTETTVVRPKGTIHRRTGLPVVLRDFNLSGVAIQNSATLESYLLGEEQLPEAGAETLEQMMGKGLLLHFHPRLYYPKDLEIYRPQVPAAFSVLAEVVRGSIDTGKEAGRLATLGLSFRCDPADYDPETLEVTAWESIRGLRDNAPFKEIHRALNGLLAYLER